MFIGVISAYQAPLPLKEECPQIGTQPLLAFEEWEKGK